MNQEQIPSNQRAMPEETAPEVPGLHDNQEAENTSQATSGASSGVEIRYGRITYLSEEKGAFVELIAGPEQETTLRAETRQSSEKLEIFVPKELIADKKNLARDLLVQLKRVGDTIVDIEPF
jgi:hypothetical protein